MTKADDAAAKNAAAASAALAESASFEDMRTAVATVDALAAATHALFDAAKFGEDADQIAVGRIFELISATKRAAEEALLAVDRHNAVQADQKLSPWSNNK